jgi:hypothetical protein
MATLFTVGSYGTKEFTIASGDSITLKVTGESATKVLRKVGYPNYPDSWDTLTTINDTGSTTLGPYTSNLTFRVEGGAAGVEGAYGADLQASGLEDPSPSDFFPNPKVGAIIEYFEDFLDAGTLPADPTTDTIDWEFTILEAGGGDAAIALADTQGGVVTITNDAGDNDRVVAAKNGESFLFVAGKKTWYRAKFSVNDVDDVDAFMGLVIQTATDPVGTAPTDGVFFRLQESDADGGLDLVVTKDSTATTQAVATMVDATMIDVAFFYNGVDSIEVYADDAWIASVAVTNLPDDEELSVFFAIQNGAAAADSMSIDYIYAAQER